ncbi:glycosyl hydrolase family 28-related protein [Chryseobacterium arthrosphaerae]|uniref:glycosyl hydrolase family 28-related protein n=1 Tax=Chryseobacterium arthrosphaerae TaxID=651561 RepID=UPI003D32E727
MPNLPIPFVEPFPIKDLPEEPTLKPNGHMLVEGNDGRAYRISTESFYQLLQKIATPILPSQTGPFIANSWFKPQVNSKDPGTSYPNLTPAKDENGNPTVLKAVEGYDTLFYFNGTYWISIPNKLPQDEVVRKVLKSFVNPQGDGPWEAMSFPSSEYQGYVLNQNAVGEANQYGAWGEFQASYISGASSLRILAQDMDKFGGTVSWWLGFRPDNTFDVLKSGVIVNGVAQIDVDPQYSYYKYSRPLAGSVLQKRSKIALPVEEDAVLKAIENLGSGYSGILDLGTVGVSQTNSSAQNTQIINDAIESESKKSVQRVLALPPGIFMVNELILQPSISLIGAGDALTVLRTDAGSTAKHIITLPDGKVGRGLISDILIDARNATEGAVYINNTFDYEIKNCIIDAGQAKYGIKITGGLYHTMSNIYMVGGEISLLINHVAGSMGTNLIKYDRVYIVKSIKKCVEINGGSNYAFNSCNFEDCGTSGDENTGGVHAIGVSAGGEGVDVVFNNCWAEGVRGGFIYKIDNCKGNSVIRDCMMGNGGNGTGTIANAIINVGSNLLLSGATRFSTAPHFNPFPTNVRTIGSTTYVDNPNINIGINNVGPIKTAQYS